MHFVVARFTIMSVIFYDLLPTNGVTKGEEGGRGGSCPRAQQERGRKIAWSTPPQKYV